MTIATIARIAVARILAIPRLLYLSIMRKICQRVTFRGDCLSLVTLPITRHDKFYLNNVD
jgi:hypothetical protein